MLADEMGQKYVLEHKQEDFEILVGDFGLITVDGIEYDFLG